MCMAALLSTGLVLPLPSTSAAQDPHFLSVQQQMQTVKGIVVDNNGEPVIGATISIGGKAVKITDIDGKFVVQTHANELITITSVGYSTKKVKATPGREMHIVMADDALTVQEVQVVAYGAQKKVTVTGAISGINGELLTKVPTASITNMLAGSVPGISSVQYSGEPGADGASLFVRGKATWANSAPLVQVDGVERDFSEIDPNEIESVTVLKDASATAVFGVRGANGVILVTTKRGKEGKANISVNTSASVVLPTNLLKLADSYSYALYHNQMMKNDGAMPLFSDAVVQKLRDHSDPIRYPDTDWMDYCLKKAAFQSQHNVSISGGTNNVRYFVSLGAFTQGGLFKQQALDYDFNFNYKRFNYRANLDFDVTKTTTISVNIGGRADTKNTPISTEDGQQLFRKLYNTTPFSSPGVIGGRYVLTTTDPDEDGNHLPFTGISGLSSYYGMGYTSRNTNVLNADVMLRQKLDMITKGLSFKVKGSYNSTYYITKKRPGGVATYNPVKVGGNAIEYRKNGQDSQLGYSEEFGKGRNWYMEASLDYARGFGQHHVGALLLYNQSKTYYPSQYSDIPHGYVGLVSRVTYDYANRYMAEFNVGYNGSENFAPGKRYGLFPAGSVGWTISEEQFFKPLKKVVDYLKLRASWGLVGNDQLNGSRFMYTDDPYVLKSGWSAYGNKNNTYNFGTNTGNYLNGAIEGAKHNPEVTWEKSFKQDYGVDANFLNSRLKATFDYYYEHRKDILLNSYIAPGILGFTLPAANLGEVNSWGYEVSLKWQDFIGKNLRYWVGANLSYNQNEIKEMMEAPQNYDWLYQKGHRIGSRSIRQFWGLYSADADARYMAEYGKHLPTHPVALENGDAVYADLNGDGIIDNNDYSHSLGHTDDPEYTAGFNLGFQYKDFEFNTQWTAAWNVTRMLADCFRQPLGDQQEKALLQYQFDNVWTPDNPNPNARYPRATKLHASNNYASSTLYEVNSAYLRLKTMQVAYHFHFPWMNTIKLRDLTLALSGYNLLTFSKFKWGDPESRTSDRPNYPLTRSFAISLKASF